MWTGSRVCHEPADQTVQKLGMIQLIDRQFPISLFCGVLQIAMHLQDKGRGVIKIHIRRLMPI